MGRGYIETFRGMVYPRHCDHQGHMTTMHYVGMFDPAFYHQVAAMGFTRAYLAANGTGFVDVKDTIEYRRELVVGALVVVESGLLRLGRSSMTAFHVMRDADTGTIAATSEKVSAYFDLAARATLPLPDDRRAVMETFLVPRRNG